MELGIRHDRRPRPARRLRAAAACSAVLIVAGAAGCGPASRAPGAGASGACPASRLKVTIDIRAAGAAAGSAYYPIEFTNASAVSCHLDGYPDTWFGTSAGHRIGAAAGQDQGVTAHPVHLPPGATAHAWLQITGAANYPAKACRPVIAHMLLIRAPGAASASPVRRAFPACAAAMHGHGILTIQPVLPGRASRGSAQ